MLTAEARVTTDRASRYLVQLCEHLDQIGRQHLHRGRMHTGTQLHLQQVDWSDTHGIITFDRGQCTVDATPDTLTLRAEAADADTLQQMQDMLARRFETIGRRDHLAVAW